MLTEKELIQLEYDKKQMQFAIDGVLILNQKLIDEQTPLIALINSLHYWICPFCLETSNKFTIESHGLIKCPNCSLETKIKTLLFVKDCTNEEYAQWVFNYRLSGFFKKINFEKWSKKLKELGINYEFWEHYKKLKGDYQENKQEDKFELTKEMQDRFIQALILRINMYMTKDEIYKELQEYDVNIDAIDFCYNEALLKVKNGSV